MRANTWLFAAAVVAAALFVPSVAAPQTLGLHHGDLDPVTEGWTFLPFGTPGFIAEPVLDGGVPVWSVRGNANYQRLLSPSERAPALQAGYTLTAIFRILGITDPAVTYPVGLSYNDPLRANALFGRRATGELFVKLVAFEPYPVPPGPSGPEYTIPDRPEGYHRFDLVYRVPAQRVDLYVDGVLRIANHPGYVSAIQLGTLVFYSAGPGEKRFFHVEMRVGNEMPVPAQSASWGAIKALYRAADGS